MTHWAEKTVSIILAAGKSTRMRSVDRAKVCYPIAGKPAILHLLHALKQAEITRHVIVVGKHAQQVMETVSSEYPEVIYAFQREQLGTGHAARVGMKVLQQFSFSGRVLVIAGDKVIKRNPIMRLISRFEEESPDLAFLVGDKAWEPTAGRIVYSLENEPIASIEKFDSGRSRLLAAFFANTDRGAVMEAERALSLAGQFIGPNRKIKLAIGDLYTMLQNGQPLTRDLLQKYFSAEDRLITLAPGHQITGAEVEKSRYVNLSVYVFKADALYQSLKQISSKNAQREEYLTDVISILHQQQRRVLAVKAESADEVMSFNTPEELQRIEERMAPPRATLQTIDNPKTFVQKISEWQKALSRNGRVEKWLGQLFGRPEGSRQKNVELLRHCLEKFREHYGDRPALIARSPARINLMGRHVDHQGGPCNTFAINREIYLIASARQDRVVRLKSLQPRFYVDREFSLDEFNGFLHQQDWQDFLRSSFVMQAREALPGDWSHYIRGVLLRLQKQFPEISFQGMDVMVGGNIPPGSGLSSSSALVVAAAQAAIHLNGLPVTREELVEYCAQAEWFVGTRGGSSDHAAILFGKPGKINHLEFFPFRNQVEFEWPEELYVMICHCGKSAEKNTMARALFNQRVACYKIAVHWFKRRFPELSEHIHLVRDLYPAVLHKPLTAFYQLLLELPERVRGDQIQQVFPEVWNEYFAEDAKASNFLFPLRDVLIYGLSEIERSRRFALYLQRRNYTEIGHLMSISHNGDRVSSWKNGVSSPFRLHFDNQYLNQLTTMARQGLEAAALYFQPGAYGCSIPEIDLIVDLASEVEGVIGAQIAGAGLGGSAMILLQKSAIQACAQKLNQYYYAPRGLQPKMFLCHSVDRADVLRMPG